MARNSLDPYNPGMANRRSIRFLVLSVSTLIGVCLPTHTQQLQPNPPANDGRERVAPAFRAERHFEVGAAYLRGLPDGTTVDVRRLDGAQFTLALSGGVLKTNLPASSVSTDGFTLTTPLGYTLAHSDEARGGLKISAPNGQWAIFNLQMLVGDVFVTESDAVLWKHNRATIGLRLPDGSRVDALDEGARWELISLLGERFALANATAPAKWETLPKLPSPPLIPDMDTFLLSGDGNDWYKPAREDHLVFGWGWWPAGLSLEQAINDVTGGFRRADLSNYFQGLEFVQSGSDMGGCLLGRRLALGGGDQLTFKVPGREPATAYLLPGALDPDYFETKKVKQEIPGVRRKSGK